MPVDDAGWAPIIPELVVSDFSASLAFWTEVLGFDVMYRRTEPDFVMIRLSRAQVMLEVSNETSWLTGEMERPFGRGINLEIEHPDPSQLAARLSRLGVKPYRSLRESRYLVAGVETVQLAVLVQDPDGYLLRFASDVT
jgi:catechol 2,3-dioxygenase-like lactoylglutathione lyase family enzyme